MPGLMDRFREEVERETGAELMAAQGRGELATQEAGRPIGVRSSDASPATLAKIGIPRQRAAKYQKLAEIGEARMSSGATQGLNVERAAVDLWFDQR